METTSSPELPKQEKSAMNKLISWITEEHSMMCLVVGTLIFNSILTIVFCYCDTKLDVISTVLGALSLAMSLWVLFHARKIREHVMNKSTLASLREFADGWPKKNDFSKSSVLTQEQKQCIEQQLGYILGMGSYLPQEIRAAVDNIPTKVKGEQDFFIEALCTQLQLLVKIIDSL